MRKDKEKGVSVKELMQLIPDEALCSLAKSTKVDYYTKVLYGRSVFYMILYSLLESERTSLRSMEDIFNSRRFKFLFNLDNDVTVKYNSISDRLAVMDVSFFEKAFDLFYQKLSKLYSKKEMLESKIVRVDSTMVAETSTKLSQGMIVGAKKKRQENNSDPKLVKFTIGFDGLLPCSAKVFTDQTSLSEDYTIPKVVFNYAKKTNNHVFVFDRGVQKRTVFEDMSIQNIEFVGRLNPGARKEVVRVIEEGGQRRIGSLFLERQEEVRLYRNNGTRQKTDETFRLITARDEDGETYLFLTNIFDVEAESIVLYYRKRWDIEVFFRFIKQELSFSHFISTNENGIKIILYMTLILSMLVMIYKRLNNVGYKTAKRRFEIELDELIMAMVIKIAGGDPDLVFR